jgi:tetratricopeptide (TPR) repeat protein
MAKRQKDRQLARKKKRNVRRRKAKLKSQSQPSRIIEPSAKVSRKLEEVYELIEDGDFDEAELIINRLDKRYSQIPAVIETQLYLYQELDDHEQRCLAAKQLMKLTPNDPDSVIMYAQQSLICGGASIALLNYRRFLKRWPDHENASKARAAIEICEPECLSRLERARQSGFTELTLNNGGLELFARHEESLEQLRAGNFEVAITLCRDVLEAEPNFLSARNNLATCCFQNGELESAVATARETCRLAPNNRFAEANLAKLEFLTGNLGQANLIANRIALNPPNEQDALVAAIESLSYLGRDEDVVALSTNLDQIGQMDDEMRAIGLHHFAVAVCRLGDELKARNLWKRCLTYMPSHPGAMANLDDLDSGEGHAAWGEPISKWLPKPAIARLIEMRESDQSIAQSEDLAKSVILPLIPALLDRGDPVAREFALKLAISDASTPMLDALKQFALSDRGPDTMRNEALMFLHNEDVIDAGPHRFFSRGVWKDVKLFNPEIVFGPTEQVEPWESKLAEIGFDAQNCGDYEKAEGVWLQILKRSPDNASAAFNLAVIWMNRDGATGRKKATAKFEELHEQHPDYLFASLALANVAAKDGNFDRAGELLGNAMEQKRLHVTEATALFSAQIQLAVKRREFDSAETAYDMLINLVGEDHPAAIQSRDFIDKPASLMQRLTNAFSPF